MGSERPDRTTETAKIARPQPPRPTLRKRPGQPSEAAKIGRSKRTRSTAPNDLERTFHTAGTRRLARPEQDTPTDHAGHSGTTGHGTKKRDGRPSLCGQSPVSMLRFPKEAGHYIMPMPFMPAPAAGIAGAGSFFSASTHSVVRNIEAIEAAFSKATRATLVGSRIPASSISS